VGNERRTSDLSFSDAQNAGFETARRVMVRDGVYASTWTGKPCAVTGGLPFEDSSAGAIYPSFREPMLRSAMSGNHYARDDVSVTAARPKRYSND